MIAKVRGTPLLRSRLGPSSHAIGDAVRHNLAERGVSMSPDEFTSAWSTRQLADGRWAVRFTFHHRNKDQVLRFDLDEARTSVVAVDRVSNQLGYVAPPPSARPAAPARPRPSTSDGDGRPSPKRATVTTGFRADAAPTKATSRPAKERERANAAMRKAAKQRAAESERVAARKAREKQAAAERREREQKVAAVRKAREQAAAERVKARERAAAERAKAAAAKKKAAAAKKRAAERARQRVAKQAADQAKRAEAALVAAERAAARKAAAGSSKPKAAEEGHRQEGHRQEGHRQEGHRQEGHHEEGHREEVNPTTKRAAAKKAPAKQAVTRAPVAKKAAAPRPPTTPDQPSVAKANAQKARAAKKAAATSIPAPKVLTPPTARTPAEPKRPAPSAAVAPSEPVAAAPTAPARTPPARTPPARAPPPRHGDPTRRRTTRPRPPFAAPGRDARGPPRGARRAGLGDGRSHAVRRPRGARGGSAAAAPPVPSGPGGGGAHAPDAPSDASSDAPPASDGQEADAAPSASNGLAEGRPVARPRRTQPLPRHLTVGASAPAVPTTSALRGAGLAAGLDIVEVASAEPFVEVRRTLEQRKAEGLHGGMAFTYRQPAKSTDPSTALPDARALVVGARSYLVDDRDDDSGEPAGRIARYAWDDHYAILKTGLKAIAAVLKAEGWRARVLADDNAMVDRAAAHRAGIGWWGKNANLLVPGLGSWYVLGSVVTDAPLSASASPIADRCGPCTRCLDGCPTGAITAPGVVDARRCLSWLLQAEGGVPRASSASPSATGSTGATSARRCARRTVGRRVAPARAPNGRGRRSSTCSTPTTPSCSRTRSGGTSPSARCATSGATPSSCSATWVTATPRRWSRRWSARSGDADPLLRAHAVWAARRLGREDLLPRSRPRGRPARARGAGRPHAMTHLFVTNDFPPKIGGIQTMLWELWRRLDPSSFAVLTTPHPEAAAWDAEQAVPGGAHRAEGAAAHAVADPAHRRAGRGDRRRPRGARPGPARRPGRTHALRLPVRRRAPRRRGHRARPAPRSQPGAATRPARRRPRHRGGRLPAGRGGASGRSGAAERDRAARRRHRAVPPARRRGATSGARSPRPARRRPAGGEPQPAGAPQGHGHADPGRGAAGADPSRPHGRDRWERPGPRRLARLVESTGAPVRLLGRVSHDDLPVLYGSARRVRHALPQPLGGPRAGGLRHRVPRGRRRRASRRWPGTAGVRPRPWCTARPGWWCPSRTIRVRSPTPSPGCSTDPDLRARMGRGRTRARRGRLRLRRAGRAARGGAGDLRG